MSPGPNTSSPKKSIKIGGMTLDENDAVMRLFQRCYDNAIERKKRDTQIRNPFPPYNMLSNPWDLYQKFYDGDQWGLLRTLESWMSRPISNKCMVAVEAYTTLLTDHDPMFSASPVEPNDFQLAERVSLAYDHWWRLNSMKTTLSLAIKDSRKFGIGWLYLYYDEDIKDCRSKVIHPENLLVDPDCTIEDFNPTYVIYSYRAGVGELFVKHSKAFEDEKQREIYFDENWNAEKGNQNRILDRMMPWKDTIRNPAESCMVYELWIKDGETIEWDEELDDKIITRLKLKNPGGLRITVAGGRVLAKVPNPYDHKEIPFTPFPAYPQSGKFYCAGDIQNIISAQVMRNRMAQLLHDFTVKAGGAMIFIGKRAQLKSKAITNAPVQIHQVADASQINIQTFPTPGRHVFNYINVLDNDMDGMLGLHEISQGENLPGNKSAFEIQVMSESDKTRVRMAARWVSRGLERMAKQLLMNWAQWPDFEYYLKRVSGEDADIPGFEDEPKAYTIDKFTGADLFMPEEKTPSGRKKKNAAREMIKWDIDVGDSSTLPWSQSERFQLGMQLFQAGVIDDIALLEFIRWPGYKNIIARKEEMMKQQAQAQPMGGGMPGDMAAMMGGMGGMGAPAPEAQMGALGGMPPPAPGEPLDLETIAAQIAMQTGLSVDEIIPILEEALAQGPMEEMMSGAIF